MYCHILIFPFVQALARIVIVLQFMCNCIASHSLYVNMYILPFFPFSSFANGRSTALVVDSGATQTSVVPVHDGYALQGAVLRTPLAGDFIVAQCKHFIEDLGVEIVPPYMIATKEAVKEKAQAVWTKKSVLPQVTDSYHNYMVNVSDTN